MVKQIKLSEGTIESVLRDVQESSCSDIIGDIENAPIFVLIPLNENQVIFGIDASLEEVGIREKELLPTSLIPIAIFRGEGCVVTQVVVGGVSISVKDKGPCPPPTPS